MTKIKARKTEKRTVESTLHYKGQQTVVENKEQFYSIDLGDLIGLYFKLENRSWWRRIFESKLENKFALKDIRRILNSIHFEIHESGIKWIIKYIEHD